MLSRAERNADGKFILPRRGPRQQKICDIHAGDEKNKRDGTQQDKKDRAHVAYHFVLQRKEIGFLPGVESG